jgi:transcriptional regulator with XRE-family HTH domain
MVESDKSVNQRLLEARKLLGLPQTQFAEKIKVSYGYVASLEIGKRKVNDRIIKLVSMTFGISEEWLKTGKGNCFDEIDEFKLEQVIRTFKKLDPFFKDYVLKQFNSLLDLQKKEHGGGK